MASAALKKQKPSKKTPQPRRILNMEEPTKDRDEDRAACQAARKSKKLKFGPCGSCTPPGILQDVNAGENGAGDVQRCDECAIYPDDEAAARALNPKSVIPLNWDALKWTDCDDEAPGTRLLTTLTIGHVWFHVEAVEVADDSDEMQQAISPLGKEQLDHLFGLDGAGGWQEAEINGRSYVIFMVPHSR